MCVGNSSYIFERDAVRAAGVPVSRCLFLEGLEDAEVDADADAADVDADEDVDSEDAALALVFALGFSLDLEDVSTFSSSAIGEDDVAAGVVVVVCVVGLIKELLSSLIVVQYLYLS